VSRLSVREREEIALARARGATVTEIAGAVGRPKSTVSRELSRNRCGDGRYLAFAAQARAEERTRRPRPSKLAQDGPLREYVAKGLDDGASPEQISHRLRAEFPDDEGMRVSHETIYQAVYVQARGGLRREVERALRRGGTRRRPRREDGRRRARVLDMTSIRERPAEVESRTAPGDWEGDLIIGKDSGSAVATVVGRTTRFTMLGHLGDDHTAETVRQALEPLFEALPEALRRSLTWDQGIEMATHKRFTEDTRVRVFFCDPHSPWQRGTNENTNGLLRQYLPKGTDLSVHSPDDLAEIAARLNRRPRRVLNWLTPAEAFGLLRGEDVRVGGRSAAEIAPEWLKTACQAA
jgi:IS30 family transposase